MMDFAQRRTMMVDTQVRPNDVTSYPVIEAMLNVPREEYVPENLRDVAYVEENLQIGHQRTLLEPRTLGRMLDALQLRSTDLVLDVGCGYGYASAVMARIVEAVVAIDTPAELTAEAQARLAAQEVFNVAVMTAPLNEGCPAQAPYDAIVISGGSIEEFPETLTAQLREGGRAVAVMREGHLGICKIGIKNDGVITWRYAFNASAPDLPEFKRAVGFAL